MSLFGVDSWLKSPADRDIITRWTVGADRNMSYALDLPALPDPDRFTFLVFGDTGDSDASGPQVSPQDAVARQLTADAALPGSAGDARLVLHVGDLVYMTGERRLYDRNFRRPYAAFLTPESTVDNLTFRLPFLTVPGNHDYYDLGDWVRWLTRIPILGSGLRAITHELFAFSLPEGGSDMGRAYMEAFVDLKADTRSGPYPYRPGERTRLPNRYYRFRMGTVDFFALDSNTLDAPPPWKADAAAVRANAAERVHDLEEQARKIDARLCHDERACERWRDEHRERLAADPSTPQSLAPSVKTITNSLGRMQNALGELASESGACRDAVESVVRAARRWSEADDDLSRAGSPESIRDALKSLQEASDEICSALKAVEGCMTVLPTGQARNHILSTMSALESEMDSWSKQTEPLPVALCANLRKLSEEALDIQRELALERRRMRYRPEDYDTRQIEWLKAGLEEAVRERPNGWRVVYLHHPLYSSIANHCEHPDVQGVRDNLLAALGDKAHLVLGGHAHAFEWFRSDALPTTALFVTGGGGQVSLRRSLLDPALVSRRRAKYDALRRSGIVECAVAGRGPATADGESGSLYHYLRVEVTPDALRIRPVGVRRLPAGYRREEPMPVFHVAELAETRPSWKSRRLVAIEARRDEPPRAIWA